MFTTQSSDTQARSRKHQASQLAIASDPHYSSVLPLGQPIVQRKSACPCGGGCPACQSKPAIQTKLSISAPGDIYEQEADRIADQVLATPAHPAVRGASPHIQRFTGQPTGQTDSVPVSVDSVIATPGRPLDPMLLQDMEQRFGHDFSRVRVHSGAAAERSARDVNAHAYTVGHDVVFAAGRYSPGTRDGRRLIAHELTHVVQQRGNAVHTLRRSLDGCQNLIDKEKGLGLISGIMVHKLIAADFQKKVKGARRKNVLIPGASAGPLRTDEICGKPSPEIDPQEYGGMDPKAGAGIPDLARVTRGGILQVAEIKPASLVCLIDGEEQFLRYIDQGNASDKSQTEWRASQSIKVVAPLSNSVYPAQKFQIMISGGAAVVETGWCTPGLLAYAVTMKAKRGRKSARKPVPVPVPAKQPSPVRVRLKGYHPYFEGYVNQLPYFEEMPGRVFIVAFEDGIYRDAVAEAARRINEQAQRSMKVDPRGIPMFQVGAPLVGIAYISGAISIVILAALIVPMIPGLVTAAIGEGVAAAAATRAAFAAATAGLRWGVVQLTRATAAGIVVRLVSGGVEEAEAAKAVEPLIDKRIVAVADVTGNAELENAKPGQEISVDGQTFRAIMLLTTRDYEE